MVSRIVLGLQYLLIMWHVRKYQNTKVPFLLIAASNFVAAAVYLGVTLFVTIILIPPSTCSYASSAFGDKNSTAYRSFYVMAVFEIATNIIVSSIWKAATFKGTHLVQRMSLLTLIILGEGVMTTVGKITTARRFSTPGARSNMLQIVYNENAWDGPTIGTIIAAISIVVSLSSSLDIQS
jgi:low temperature requirement protein LtrA